MPVHTTTDDQSSGGIPNWAATTGRASFVKLRAATGARLFRVGPRHRAHPGTGPYISGAPLSWRDGQRVRDDEPAIRDANPHATHRGQHAGGQRIRHRCGTPRDQVDLDPPRPRTSRPLAVDTACVEPGDPHSGSPWPGRAGIPQDRPADGHQHGSAAA